MSTASTTEDRVTRSQEDQRQLFIPGSIANFNQRTRGVLRRPGLSTFPRLANGLLDEKRSQTNRNFVLRFGPR